MPPAEDPLGFGAGINVYAYADNNPINLIDPLGLESGDLNRLVPGPNGETATNAPSTTGSFGTLSIGGTINVSLGPLGGQLSAGLVIDSYFNVALYKTYTPIPFAASYNTNVGGVDKLGNLAPSHLHPFAPPPGSEHFGPFNAVIGVSGAISNAQTVCDLAGPFVSGGVGGGEGLDGTIDGFAGTSRHGTVAGGGLTLGGGLGASGGFGLTNTELLPIFGRKSDTGCPGGN